MNVVDWGLIEYRTALDRQIELVQEVIANENHPGFLVLCAHPAVVTTGRQTQASDIFSWQGPIVEVSRGGRATYHGPSQVVAYPIVSIKKPRKNRGPQEVRGFMRDVEQAIVRTIAHYGITGHGKISDYGSALLEDTGVWLTTPAGPRKLASLGIGVKRWVTFHGAAINVLHDENAFVGINPCGFKSEIMTSLEQATQQKIDLEEFKEALVKEMMALI